MQDAVLTYWHEGSAPQFYEFRPGTVALWHSAAGIEVVATPPLVGASEHVADLTYAEDLCSLTWYGAREHASVERADKYDSALNAEVLAQSNNLVLDNGDTLRIGRFSLRFIQNSRYLHYLPAPFHNEHAAPDIPPHFTGRFLMIFERMLDPIALMLGQIDRYFSPFTAPVSLLPYLASWFDLDMSVPLAPADQRRMLQQAVEINRWRSTPYGLKLHIQACTGIEADIVEWYAAFDGTPMPLAGELPNWMRQRAHNSAPPNAGSGCFSILLPTPPGAAREQLVHTVDAIARLHRPVHSTYEIWVQTGARVERCVPHDRGQR